MPTSDLLSPRALRSIEGRTHSLGRMLLSHAREQRPFPLSQAWAQDVSMQQMMHLEGLKLRAFRFVDALPTLRSTRSIARHLREYFGDLKIPAANSGENVALAKQLYPLIRYLLDIRDLDGMWARFVSGLAQVVARTMANSFLAGDSVEAALKTIHQQRRSKLAFTLDVLGEFAVSPREAQYYWDTYQELFTTLPDRVEAWPSVDQTDTASGHSLPRTNISVKVTALNPGFDPLLGQRALDHTKELLRPLLRAAIARNVHFHVDMEHHQIKDLTLELCMQLFDEHEFRDYPHVGLVLQAYLRSGDEDLQRIIDYARRRPAPVWIRLVKGAYWDSETVWARQKGWPIPVWSQKWQSDACYERMTRQMLLNHRVVHGAFASHNVRSLAHALAVKQELDVPDDAFEWQMLYGMGDELKHAAVAMGQRCRVYTPYGALMPGMAYLIRRLLENTANESFLRLPKDEDAEPMLLRNPADFAASQPELHQPVVAISKDSLMQPFRNTAHTDFADPENRGRFVAAIKEQRAQTPRDIPLLIGSDAHGTDARIDSVNPARPSHVLGHIAQADADYLDRAVATAETALLEWQAVAPRERAQLIERFADLLETHRFELAALLTLEIGKTWRDADAEICEGIDYCRYYLREWLRLATPRHRDIPGEMNEYFYIPRGVIGIISSWALPAALTLNALSAALVTGNTVVLTPPDQASVTIHRLVELLREAGLPDGAVNLLPGPATLLDQIAEHSAISMVTYDGSRARGEDLFRKAIAASSTLAGFKKFTAELGGKNAIIVDDDANLDEAISGILESSFGFAGQKSSSCERLIVLDEVYERLLERLTEASAARSIGPGDDPSTSVPAVIDTRSDERIRKTIQQAHQYAKALLDPDTAKLRDETGGYFIGPTLFVDVPLDSALARDEVCGPVLAIFRAHDMTDAIRIFNDCDYALTGGIYSRSPAHIEAARRDCLCGNLYINRPIVGSRVDLQPFGGFRASGIDSKIGGPDYLIQFCLPRTITENTIRRGFAPEDEGDADLAAAADLGKS